METLDKFNEVRFFFTDRKIKSIRDVIKWHLCLGCGVCAYICPEKRINLINIFEEGIRPILEKEDCGSCRLCLDVCPAVHCDYFNEALNGQLRYPKSFIKEWGPIKGIWDGFATDPDICYKGSSGGVLTAIGAYCIEKMGMYGVLQTGQDQDDPISNRTRLSRSRKELLLSTGSRYSPASVCDCLELVESAPAPCAVVGRPAEIAAIKNARGLRPDLSIKIGITLSFFCAESPSTSGTITLLNKFGLSPAMVKDLRYRGNGWPGNFTVICGDESGRKHELTYRESWSFLQAFRPWSIQMWPDGSGELADITCGDPWYVKPDGKNPGISLVIARTNKGREVIEGAIDEGYLTLKSIEHWKLIKSQSGLLTKKGSVWGRRLALRLFGFPVGQFPGLDLWHCWCLLTCKEKLKSILGTIRRIISRKLYLPSSIMSLKSRM